VKKLIFLLIMAVALVGMVPAYTHPSQGLFLEAAMSEIGVENCAIVSDSGSISVVLLKLPEGYLVMPAVYNTGQSQGYYLIKPIDTGQTSSMYDLARETRKKVDESLSAMEKWVIDTGQTMISAKTDFWLRLQRNTVRHKRFIQCINRYFLPKYFKNAPKKIPFIKALDFFFHFA
jgi:hypothetical protein